MTSEAHALPLEPSRSPQTARREERDSDNYTETAGSAMPADGGPGRVLRHQRFNQFFSLDRQQSCAACS